MGYETILSIAATQKAKVNAYYQPLIVNTERAFKQIEGKIARFWVTVADGKLDVDGPEVTAKYARYDAERQAAINLNVHYRVTCSQKLGEIDLKTSAKILKHFDDEKLVAQWEGSANTKNFFTAEELGDAFK